MSFVFLCFTVIIFIKSFFCFLQISHSPPNHSFFQKCQTTIQGVKMRKYFTVFKDCRAAIQGIERRNDAGFDLPNNIACHFLNWVVKIVIAFFLSFDLFKTASYVATVFGIIFFEGILRLKASKLAFWNSNTYVYPKNVINALWWTPYLKIDDLRNISINKSMKGAPVFFEA